MLLRLKEAFGETLGLGGRRDCVNDADPARAEGAAIVE
jgi:hypothetical protein